MALMKKQLELFFIALLFYTRIPCPKWVAYSDDKLNQSSRYFPAIGFITGGFAVLVYSLSSLVFPPTLSVLLAMIAPIWLTGAFHEDGFADVCDGFGGGWTAERILTIMKDSRLGTYGTVGLMGLLAAKFLALTALPAPYVIPALLVAHVWSRWTALNLVRFSAYARLDATSKTKPIGKQLHTGDYIWATLLALPALLLIPKLIYLVVLLPMPLLIWRMKVYFEKWIGGFTGDCLGATQQLAELLIYLTWLGLSSYYGPTLFPDWPWN